MRNLLRFFVVLGPLLLAVAWAGSFALEKYQQSAIERDLDRRARLLYRSTEEVLTSRIERGDTQGVQRMMNHFSQDELVQGVLICTTDGHSVAGSTLDSTLSCDTIRSGEAHKELSSKNYHLSTFPLVREGQELGQLYLISDGGPWIRRLERMRFGLFLLFLSTGIAVIAASTWAAKWTLTQPLRDLRLFIKEGLRAGDPRPMLKRLQRSDFAPLVRDLIQMSADMRARNHDPRSEGVWNPARLRAYVRRQFNDTPLCVISNREPFVHVKAEDGRISCLRPASGLVTGVEPILKACDGIWIAHGSGSGDTLKVDASDRLRVPEEDPEYTLRRVWLSEQEERGYYYGFSNEGLWPLCHISYQRPRFEFDDWQAYKAVNEKFADAFLAETKGAPAVVLVQDYHFALLPRLIKERSPESLVLLFWHIPWPNAETFGICPWKQDILHGMLGADVLGFHTQYHCNNFVDTVDRFMESRIDREFFNVQLQGQECRVRTFPISIDASGENVAETLPDIRQANGLSADMRVILSVDRVDYTKGIPERLRAIERFAELRPDLARTTTFIQIGAPSRTTIAAYRDLNTEVWKLAQAVNDRFRSKLGRDLVLLKLEHHNPEQLKPYYAQADVCLVTPLHDGMNLVAKEYVAARTGEKGVLVLSEFAGASRELREALLINPYSPEDVASRIVAACEMPQSEQRDRMRIMRRTISDHNVYRWAYSQLHELFDVRQINSLMLDLPA